MRGGKFPNFLDVSSSVATKSQLAYVQGYVSPNIIDEVIFDGQPCLHYFLTKEVRCLFLMIMALICHTTNGKCISHPMMHYVNSLS